MSTTGGPTPRTGSSWPTGRSAGRGTCGCSRQAPGILTCSSNSCRAIPPSCWTARRRRSGAGSRKSASRPRSDAAGAPSAPSRHRRRAAPRPVLEHSYPRHAFIDLGQVQAPDHLANRRLRVVGPEYPVVLLVVVVKPDPDPELPPESLAVLQHGFPVCGGVGPAHVVAEARRLRPLGLDHQIDLSYAIVHWEAGGPRPPD